MVVGENKEVVVLASTPTTVEKNEMTEAIDAIGAVSTVDIVGKMKLWPDALTGILGTYLSVHPCKAQIETAAVLHGTRNFWQNEQLSQVSDTSKFTDRKYLWYYKVCPTSGLILDWVLIVQSASDAPNGDKFTQYRWANKAEPANWK